MKHLKRKTTIDKKSLSQRITKVGLVLGLSATMVFGSVVSPLHTNTTIALAAEERAPEWGYNNGQIYSEQLPEAVRFLNQNIQKLVVYTLGFRVLEEYYPGEFQENNPLILKDGRLNPSYRADRATKGSEGDNLVVFKSLKRYETGVYETNIRFVKIIFNGTYNSILMYYPENLPTEGSEETTDDSTYDIFGQGSMGYKLYLRVKMEADGKTIQSVEDNHTQVSGPDANFWNSFKGAGGFSKYVGKTLDDVKRMDVGEELGVNSYRQGVDGISGATATSIDVRNIVQNFLEKEGEKNSSLVDKKPLVDKKKEAENYINASEEYVEDEAFLALKTAYDKAVEVIKDKTATEKEVQETVTELDKALQGNFKLKPVKTTELKTVIDEAKSFDLNMYLEESGQKLRSALEEAEQAYQDSLEHNNIRQRRLDELAVKLEEAIAQLEEKDSEDVKRHEITGKLVQYGSQDEPSMASGALKPEIQIKEMGGKTTYYLSLKPIEVGGAKSQVEDIKHIEDGVDQPSKKVDKEGDYNQVFFFTRNSLNEESFTLKLGAKMGGPNVNYQRVTLKLDLSGKTPDMPEVDKTRLKQVLDEAVEVSEAVEAGEYKEEGATDFRQKHQIAKEVYANPRATEDEVDDAMRQLSSVIHLYLVLKPVDTEAINGVIERANGLDRTKYEEEGLAKVDEALKTAIAKRDRADYFRDIRQKYVDEAKVGLEAALSELVEKAQETPEPKLVKRVYEVDGWISQDNSDDPSMMNESFNPKVKVIEENGEFKYELHFKPLTVGNLSGGIGRLWHIVDGLDVEADLSVGDGEYPQGYILQRTGLEERVPMKVFVDIMESIMAGMGTKKVSLRLDLANKKVLEEVFEPVENENQGNPTTPDNSGNPTIPDNQGGNPIEVPTVIGQRAFAKDNVNVTIDGLKEEVLFDVLALGKVGEVDEVYDLKFHSLANQLLSLSGVDATVKIQLKETKDVDKLFYIDEAGQAKDISNQIVEKGNGSIRFTTTHFSQYGVSYVNEAQDTTQPAEKPKVDDTTQPAEKPKVDDTTQPAENPKTEDTTQPVDEPKVLNKVYIVPARVDKAGGESGPSMMNAALNPRVRVTEKDGQFIYEVLFKELKVGNLSGGISKLWVMDNGQKKEAKVINFPGEEYSTGFVFTRKAVEEDAINLKVFVDIMDKIAPGMGTKDAILVLDWAMKEVVMEETTIDQETNQDTKNEMSGDESLINSTNQKDKLEDETSKKPEVKPNVIKKTTTKSPKVKGPKTGDRGIYMFAVMGLISVATILSIKKKEESM